MFNNTHKKSVSAYVSELNQMTERGLKSVILLALRSMKNGIRH
jgi:hypothetical protein